MITIDDPETERLVRDLAARRGQSIDTVVRHAVLAQTPAVEPGHASPEQIEARLARLREIQDQFGRLPILDARSADEILGYDENGLPS